MDSDTSNDDTKTEKIKSEKNTEHSRPNQQLYSHVMYILAEWNPFPAAAKYNRHKNSNLKIK